MAGIGPRGNPSATCRPRLPNIAVPAAASAPGHAAARGAGHEPPCLVGDGLVASPGFRAPMPGRSRRVAPSLASASRCDDPLSAARPAHPKRNRSGHEPLNAVWTAVSTEPVWVVFVRLHDLGRSPIRGRPEITSGRVRAARLVRRATCQCLRALAARTLLPFGPFGRDEAPRKPPRQALRPARVIARPRVGGPTWARMNPSRVSSVFATTQPPAHVCAPGAVSDRRQFRMSRESVDKFAGWRRRLVPRRCRIGRFRRRAASPPRLRICSRRARQSMRRRPARRQAPAAA